MDKELVAIGVKLVFIAGLIVGAHMFIMHERDIGYQQAVGEAKERDRQVAAANEKLVRTLTQQRDQAVAERDQREQTIRNLAAASGNASLGLRDTVNAIRASVPSASIEALRKSTDALGAVLNECQTRYRDLAEKADRHASDVQALDKAFPIIQEQKK
jgi:ribosome-binding ATPase YchF (GTP1/OBG family)